MTGKKPRRGRGEGSIYQRKDGRFVASLRIENTGGERKYFYGRTRAEVREKLQQAQLNQQKGRLAKGPQQTVQQFLESWLEDVHKARIRINSYNIYRQLLTNHVLPALGHIRLQKLSTRDIDELYARKLKEGYAVETVRAMHRLLHRALRDAVKWKLVSWNACDDANQPRAVKYETRILTLEQAKKLMEVAMGDREEGLLVLAVTTGMRIGELLSLRWYDVNFEEGSLWVRRTVNRAGKFGLIENDPKTAASKRKILLPHVALDALADHRERQAALREKAGGTWQEHGIVFSNNHGGFIEQAGFRSKFKRLLRGAGLPDIRFHDLRHSAATILLGMGVSPKLIQELLGHSNISITMDRYSHVLPSMQREMAHKLDSLFRSEEKEQ